MAVLFSLIASAVAHQTPIAPSLSAGIFKAGAKVKTTLNMRATGIDCGPDSISWPRRGTGQDTVVVTSAEICDDCFVSDTEEGTGCAGDCEWNKNTSKCVSSEIDLTTGEWISIALSIVFLVCAIFLIIIYCCFGKRLAEAEKKKKLAEEAQKKKSKATIAEERRQTMEHQREIEADPVAAAEPPPAEVEAVLALNPEAELLVAVTVDNVCEGLKVVRGRSWNFHEQDGGTGTVGVVTRCIKAPHWWMVQWPHTAIHAYHCGKDADDRCDLAVA